MMFNPIFSRWDVVGIIAATLAIQTRPEIWVHIAIAGFIWIFLGVLGSKYT